MAGVGRSELDFDDLVHLDFLYLEHWSLALDLTILLKTIPAVLLAAGRLLSALRARAGSLRDRSGLSSGAPRRSPAAACSRAIAPARRWA